MSERSEWPIVVGGCLRSGTSLVRRLLDSHTRIHCGPEITFFRDFYGEYRDDPLTHLRFSTTVRSLVTESDALEVLGRAFVELHERAARRAGKARWADKVPENVLYASQWDTLLADRWLFVHVVRNPLDTVASMQGRFPLTLPGDLAGKSEVYRVYTEAGLELEGARPDRCRRIVYEDLCRSPAESIERLMEWLGESFEPRQLEFGAFSHQKGLEDPEVGRTDAVHTNSVGRWRSLLTDEEATVIWERTHDLWEAIDSGRSHPLTHFRGC